jgi:crossover junction endodeoxyribonuclease RuvC
MRVAGIDPGVVGGIAILEIGAEDSRVLAAIDVPTVGVKAKQRVDPVGVQEFLLAHGPQHCFFERAQAMPRQGSSSGFKYGAAVGALYATVVLCGIPITVIDPGQWKRGMQLRGKDKESARQRALELFPAAHEYFKLKKHHGRAEASLLGLYGARTRLMVTDKTGISAFTGRPAA